MTAVMSKEKETTLLTFQGVLGFKMVEKTDNQDNPYFEIYKGKNLWATFYGDKVNATSAMFTAYMNTLQYVAEEAKLRVKDPDRASEAAEGKTLLQSVDDSPIFSKNIKEKNNE